MREGVSEGLAAELGEGQQYVLTNEYLRQKYGLPRITEGVRWEIADDLKRVGLRVVSHPGVEPLIVQRPVAAAPAPATAPHPGPAALASETAPAPSGRRPWWRKAVAVGVAVVGGIFTYVNEDVVCRELVASLGQDIPVCSAEDQPVDANEAQKAVDKYFARAGGAQPQDAWKMHSTGGDRDEFIQRWEPVLGAETSRVRRAEGFNTYGVTVRTYREEDREPTKRWRVRVLQTKDGELAIGLAEAIGPINEPLRRVERVTYARNTGLYRRPRTSSKFSVAPKTKQITVGGALKALCQIDVQAADRPDDPGWWTKTELGWAPNTALGADRTDARLTNVDMCYPRARDL